MTEPEPWHRLPNERSKAYHLFCLYRDMGPLRSLEKLRRSIGKQQGYAWNLQRFSSRHSWQVRVRAFDDYILKLEEVEAIQRIRDFNKKRAEQAVTMMDQGFGVMEGEYLQSAKDKNDRFKLGFDTFRAIHKLDKEKVEHSGSVTVVFSDEVKDA
jgi:hypothetical protein